MNTINPAPLRYRSIQIGLGFIFVSFLAFVVSIDTFQANRDLFSNVFFFNYALTVVYFFLLLFRNKKNTGRLFKFNSFTQNMILLQLFNISAYSLNRSISVFNISVNWLVAFLFISNILLLTYALFGYFRKTWLNHMMMIIANLGILFHFYESIYVAEAYPITFMGFWFFGISLHTFVPLLFTITYIKVARRYLKKSTVYWPTTLATWLIAIIFISYIGLRFHQVNKTIQQSFHHSNKAYQDNSLPAWLTISQQLKKDWIISLYTRRRSSI